MRLTFLFLAAAVAVTAVETPTVAIRVDQAGYLPSMPKVAFVVAAQPASSFTIRNSTDAKVVLTGKLSDAVADPDTGDKVQSADFSAIKQTGSYYIDVAGVGRSWNFAIAPDVYNRAFYLATRSYYGQRCGIAVDLGPEFPGYKHDACHLEGAYHASSGKTGTAPSTGGWHDAGDYGRYVVNSGISTGTLLWAYELFHSRVGNVDLKLPESGNGTPDLLNEIRWNLRWMLTMQDQDGGVWHKQTSEKFCAFIMPEKDKLVSYIIGTGDGPFKSSCATGDFAAVMAIAARVYKPFDAKFAQECLTAAKNAFSWLAAHPAVLYRNPQGISTGAYGDLDCRDEALWAAAELYRTTREAAFDHYFLEHYGDFAVKVNPPGWPNVGSMALWTYTFAQPVGAASQVIRKATIETAGRMAAKAAANGYRITLSTSDYVWGSNGTVGNQALLLLIANEFKPNDSHKQAALDDLHYLLGRNTFSLSFVTQLGANPVRHPHHRPSGADNNPEPWPGLLSGGPNHSRQDPAMRKLPDGLPPAKMYLDDQESYASNEVAINWNAPLVFLLAAFHQ
jgi:endoglucanase